MQHERNKQTELHRGSRGKTLEKRALLPFAILQKIIMFAGESWDNFRRLDEIAQNRVKLKTTREKRRDGIEGQNAQATKSISIRRMVSNSKKKSRRKARVSLSNKYAKTGLILFSLPSFAFFLSSSLECSFPVECNELFCSMNSAWN